MDNQGADGKDKNRSTKPMKHHGSSLFQTPRESIGKADAEPPPVRRVDPPNAPAESELAPDFELPGSIASSGSKTEKNEHPNK